MLERISPWWEKRVHVARVLFCMWPVFLAACVTGTAVKPEPVAEPSAIAVSSAEPFDDDRQEFVITENPKMDEIARGDFERAVYLMNEQAFSQAIELLEKVVQRSPGVTAPYINLAIAYRHTDKPDLAETHLKTALGLVPEHPVAGNEYGLLCRKAGRFNEARAFYEKAIAHFPDYYPARKNLGILCDLYVDDPACALEQYEFYSAARPEDQQVKYWIADLRQRLGRE
jgi:Tfp pilus assembly protein PilF